MKTRQNCINADMARFGLCREMAQDRVKWRGCIVEKPSTRVDIEKGHSKMFDIVKCLCICVC